MKLSLSPEVTNSIRGEKNEEFHQEEPTKSCKNIMLSERPKNCVRGFEDHQVN